MSARVKIEDGDCFRIPLPDGRWAYCQFVGKNPQLGYLVRVFNRGVIGGHDTYSLLLSPHASFVPDNMQAGLLSKKSLG